MAHWRISVYDVMKVRGRIHETWQAEATQELASKQVTRVTAHLGTPETPVRKNNVWVYCECLEMVLLGLAVAGCEPVDPVPTMQDPTRPNEPAARVPRIECAADALNNCGTPFVKVPKQLTNSYCRRARRYALRLKPDAAFERLKERDQADRHLWQHYAAVMPEMTLGAIILKVFLEEDKHWHAADERGAAGATGSGGTELAKCKKDIAELKVKLQIKAGKFNRGESTKGARRGRGAAAAGVRTTVGKPVTLGTLTNGKALCGLYNKGQCTAASCTKGLHRCNGKLNGPVARACNGQHTSVECTLCMQQS